MPAALLLAAALALPGCACDRISGTRTLADAIPVIPITGGVDPAPGSLPPGVTASYPAFDGDSFSAVLPARPMEEMSSEEAFEDIAPVLQAVGFAGALEELAVPAGPIPLPAPDLAALADEVCDEAALRQDPTSREICSALQGGQVSPQAEAAFRSAYGVDLATFRRDLERGAYQYVYPQVVGGVTIEGSGVFATRREGESVSLVRGTLFNRYVVANRPSRDPGILSNAERGLLAAQLGDERPLEVDLELGSGELVLLPHGSGALASGETVPALRYALRVLVTVPGRRESWLVWIDAQAGTLLDVRPQWSEASAAQGERWRRDPGLSNAPTEVADFEVDPASGGRFILELDDAPPRVFHRFDRLGDNDFNDGELSLQATGAVANFNQSPINEEAGAFCQTGANRAYRQVHAYSHLYSFRRKVVSAGTFPEFPERPITVWVDFPDDGEGNAAFYDGQGDGRSLLIYVDGTGFTAADCPNSPGRRLNGVHDATVLTHEMAHLSVARLQERRPKSWCKPAPADPACPLSTGHDRFHDFADAFSFFHAATNCFSGWAHKNLPTANASLYCKGTTDEEGGFPRLARVGDAFAPAAAGDHFPEHRAVGKGDYADGQIAAAGLWKIYQGMRSRSLAAGTLESWVRLNRALWDFGFLHSTCKTCDRDIYRYLQDLETRLVEQWASAPVAGPAGRHTANKVLAGWAKAGIFLVPFRCFDGDPDSKDPRACPTGDHGGDAVIDVDDRDETDDPTVDGVTHPEVDYLRRGSQPPLFRVWTGPRFRFNKTGLASTAAPFPCHAKIKVEVASDEGFTVNRWESGEISAFPSGGPGCYAEVLLPDAEWSRLKGASGTATIYYRARTWSASGADERKTTQPGAGAYTVPPPFALVNDSGKP